MTDELERALQRALRREGPGKDLSGRVVSRLDLQPRRSRPAAAGGLLRPRAWRSRWLPAALAACLIAGIGLIEVRQHTLAVARANHARAELLQALSIASNNVNLARAAIAREENPDG